MNTKYIDKYLACNNIIAKHLFNVNKADEEVKLFLTQQQILQIGEEHHISNLWERIIEIFKEILECESVFYESILKEFNQNTYSKNEVPAQILALSFLTLPFSYQGEKKYHGSDYYGRGSDFLKSVGIKFKIELKHLKSIESLWVGLQKWSFAEDGNYGIFYIPELPFFQYVGKPFSQCLIKPSVLKKLPQLFYESKLIPSDKIQSFKIEQFILKNLNKLGIQGFRSNFVENQLFKATYVKYIKSHFLNWNGETSVVEQDRNKTIGGKQIIRGLLQLKRTTDGEWKMQYRVKSKSIFPEELTLDGEDFKEVTNGFSTVAELNDINAIQKPKKDRQNKIEVHFSQKEIRLFVIASKFRLSPKAFLEVDFLNKTDKFKVLVNKKSNKELLDLGIPNLSMLYEWGSHILYAVDDVSKLGGFKGMEFEAIASSRIDIEIMYGLKLNGRKYLHYGKPIVRIINAIGDEKIKLKYESCDELPLVQNQEFADLWDFPKNVKQNQNFKLYSNSEAISKNIQFVSPITNVLLLDDSNLYRRNKFGKIENDIGRYFCGSSLIDSESSLEWRRVNEHFKFYRNFGELNTKVTGYNADSAEKLYYYLTEKGSLNYQIFSEAFDFFNLDNNIDNGLSKRLTIRYLDYLGFIDFERNKNSIKVNRPQLIPIPHNGKGYKLMLIGGRSKSLINKLRALCRVNQIGFFIKKQPVGKLGLSLPKRICLRIEYIQIPNFKIKLEKLNILIETDLSSKPRILQVGISKLFTCSFKEYRNSLDRVENPNSSYRQSLFNPKTLKYESIKENSVCDGLIKHELNSFTRFFIYWNEKTASECDEEYGKYLVLNDLNKNVVLYNSDTEQIAIPVRCQLPRLFAEAIALFNGLIPENKYLKLENNSGYYNIYSNIPSTIAHNEFKRILGQNIIQVESL